MPDDDKQANLAEAKKKRAQEIDDLIVTFGASLATLLALWPEQIDEILKDVEDIAPAMLLAYLKARLPKQLETLGYYDLAKAAISKYADAVDAAHEQLEAVGFKPEELTGYDPYDLRLLQSIDVDRITRAGENTAAMIAEKAAQGSLLGTPLEQIKTGFEKDINELHTATVRTVDTGMNLTDRVVGWHLFGQKVKDFQYAGPDDLKTRPFCHQHIGVVKTMDEWMQVDNHFTPPWNQAWTWGGGLNCRHYYIPQIKA